MKDSFNFLWRHKIGIIFSIIFALVVLSLCKTILAQENTFLWFFETTDVINCKQLKGFIDMIKSILPVLLGGFFGLLGFGVTVYSIAVVILNGFFTKENERHHNKLDEIKSNFNVFANFYILSIINSIIIYIILYLTVYSSMSFSMTFFNLFVFVASALFFITLYFTYILVIDVMRLVNIDTLLKKGL